MIRRDALAEYVRGSLWVLPTLSVAAALITGSLLSLVKTGSGSPLAFQGTADDARALLIGITGTMVTVIAGLLGLAVVALQLSSTQFSPRLLRNLSAEEANLLGIQRGAPCTRIERTFYSDDGRAVETADLVVPSSLCEIVYEVPVWRGGDSSLN